MVRFIVGGVVAVGPAVGLAGEPAGHGLRHSRAPLFSPPGWFGPGPAGHAPVPVYTDWQYYGLAGGPTINPGVGGWRGFHPWAFGVPSAVGGFWTNGFGAYGPPVPTYAPQPGVFGNVEASRAYLYSTHAGVGRPPHPHQPQLGWFGRFSPSPRGLVPTVSVYAQGVRIVPAPPAVTGDGVPCVRMVIGLPDPGAKVWIQNEAMTATGAERAFVSPPLETGKTYEYQVVARWTDAAGREQAESRTVQVEAGQTARVEFGTRPASE